MFSEFENIIIKTVARILIPLIQLFALYVIVHGHSSCGGGFQGGVILAASFILSVISFGIVESKKLFSQKTNIYLRTLGILIFSGIGVVCLFFGGNYLNYAALPLPIPASEIRAVAIFLVEVGIGIVVSAIMVSIYFTFSEEKNGISNK